MGIDVQFAGAEDHVCKSGETDLAQLMQINVHLLQRVDVIDLHAFTELHDYHASTAQLGIHFGDVHRRVGLEELPRIPEIIALQQKVELILDKGA